MTLLLPAYACPGCRRLYPIPACEPCGVPPHSSLDARAAAVALNRYVERQNKRRE